MNARKFHRRPSSLISLAALVLVVAYILVLLPLGKQAEKLQGPLDKAWQSLAVALGSTNRPDIDFGGITNQLVASQQALAELERARTKAAARTELSAAVYERMNGPFQLVDYENERGRQQDDLRKLAAQHRVTLAPAALDGFPTHSTAVTQPTLLWAELAVVEGLLTTAIHCKISVIHSLTAPPVLAPPLPLPDGRTLAEVPVQIEFTAAAPAMARFLQSLPLRTAEMKAVGLPDVKINKPALFIDRLLLRKQNSEQLEELRVSLRVVGFVFRESP